VRQVDRLITTITLHAAAPSRDATARGVPASLESKAEDAALQRAVNG
jgi:hypothetical protein